jgi:hypothetical protein
VGVHIENLKRGDFIAVIDSDCAPNPIAYDGTPYRVAAVSPPFVCATVRGRVVTLDARVTRFTHVSKAYAKAWYNDEQKIEEPPPPSSGDGYARCVACGERLIQRQDIEARKWLWVCPHCDAQYGDVSCT